MNAKPLQELTLGQILDQTVARFPDNDAIVYVDRDYRLTWREFGDRWTGWPRADGLGVQKGEKVAIWATNVPHWVTLQFATAKIGAILLTVNINYKLDRDRVPAEAVGLREHLPHRRLPGHRLRRRPSTSWSRSCKTQQRGRLSAARRSRT